MHAYHNNLPGYSPDHILHDSCNECEHRGADIRLAIGSLDPGNFERAWRRAADLQLRGLPSVSDAELPMLRALTAVQLQLEQHGIPIGKLPLAHAWTD